MTKSFTTKRTGFSRKPIMAPLELVRCSCGVRMRLCDADSHEARNPGHLVLRQPSSQP